VRYRDKLPPYTLLGDRIRERERMRRAGPDTVAVGGIRAMAPRDIRAAMSLCDATASRYRLSEVYNEASFEHRFACWGEDAIHTYVLPEGGGEGAEGGGLSAMYSFHTMEARTGSGELVKAAFVDHYATTHDLGGSGPSREGLVRHMFLSAKEAGCGVIFCLGSLASVESYLEVGMEPCEGLGETYYSMYNFACPFIQPAEVGLIFWD